MTETVEAAAFDRIAKEYCRRWSDRSVRIARALLVDDQRLADVAAAEGVARQHANVVRGRFIGLVRRDAQRKVPVEEFMQQVAPSARQQAELLRPDVKRLVKHGYSDAQIGEFLQANDVRLSAKELASFLEDLRS